MKNRKQIIVLMLLCILGGLATFFYYKKEKNELTLDSGLYFISNKGYLSYDNHEEINFSLLAYFYNGTTVSDEEMIGKYSEFKVLSDKGETFPLRVKAEELQAFSNQDDDRMKQGNLKVELDRSKLSRDEIVIVKLQYKNEAGQTITRNLGDITIKCLGYTKDKNVDISLSRVEWISYVQPTINKIKMLISNDYANDIQIEAIDCGTLDLKVDIKDNKVKKKEVKELEYKATLDEKEGQYAVYYLKPSISYKVAGKTLETTADNISRQRYVDGEQSLYQYIYNMEKK